MTSEDHYQNQLNMYIDEDAKSLDGYWAVKVLVNKNLSNNIDIYCIYDLAS